MAQLGLLIGRHILCQIFPEEVTSARLAVRKEAGTWYLNKPVATVLSTLHLKLREGRNLGHIAGIKLSKWS